MIALLAALPLLTPSALLPQTPNRTSPGAPASSTTNPAQGGPGAKVPPIQDLGNFYQLTFDETDDPEGMKLDQFVKICQEVTGINFTYTKETAGVLKQAPLRMFGPKRIPKSDFYSFFQIMMIINDFVCIRIGPDHLSVVLIQSLQGTGRGGGPQVRNEATYVQPEEIDRYADQPATLITTVIDLPNTDVRTLSNSMRTMFTDANTQQIIPVGANSLIITGFGSNVASIVRMLHFVDAASKTTIEPPEFDIIKLEFAAADDIASLVEELLDASRRAQQQRAQGQPQGQGVTSPLQSGQGETKIMTDPRTNSLIVMAMGEDMPRIKELVARLDVDEPVTERTYHIYALENVAAEDLQKTLDDFIQDAQRVAPTGPGNATANRQGGAQSTTSSGRNEIVVVADKVTNSLLIAANRTRFDEVRELIKRLDHRQDQVLIETALIELSGQDQLDLAVELGGANLPGAFGVTSFGLSTFEDNDSDGVPDVRVPSVTNGVTAGILDGDEFNLPILIGALEGRRDSNVLNIPSVLVNNNGSAKVVSKDEQPTTQVTATGGVGGQTQENFRDYVNAGITLQISPTISASRYLRLKVSLEVSNFTGSVNGAIPPPKTTRTIDTTVNVPDGDTMVIGGIVTDNKTNNRSGVPWLQDIPILGFLFRSQSDTAQRTTLYFFVTPHILRDRDFADLAEVSYKKKLEAADTIGVDRIRVIDPRFGKEEQGIDLRGFEVPLYKSPTRGEVDSSSVGIDPKRLREMEREAAKQDAAKEGAKD